MLLLLLVLARLRAAGYPTLLLLRRQQEILVGLQTIARAHHTRTSNLRFVQLLQLVGGELLLWYWFWLLVARLLLNLLADQSHIGAFISAAGSKPYPPALFDAVLANEQLILDLGLLDFLLLCRVGLDYA